MSDSCEAHLPDFVCVTSSMAPLSIAPRLPIAFVPQIKQKRVEISPRQVEGTASSSGYMRRGKKEGVLAHWSGGALNFMIGAK